MQILPWNFRVNQLVICPSNSKQHMWTWRVKYCGTVLWKFQEINIPLAKRITRNRQSTSKLKKLSALVTYLDYCFSFLILPEWTNQQPCHCWVSYIFSFELNLQLQKHLSSSIFGYLKRYSQIRCVYAFMKLWVDTHWLVGILNACLHKAFLHE